MSWIWLSHKGYPQHQSTKFDALSDDSEESFVVAEFQKEYFFPQEVTEARLCFSGDTVVQLYGNGELLAMGPACVGGDFLGNGKPREWYYSGELCFSPKSKQLCLLARVKLCPTRICEYSKGRGGFMLAGTLSFADGSTQEIATDESWLARKNGAYRSSSCYDGSIPPDAYEAAQQVQDIWQASPAPIPMCELKERVLGEFTLQPGEERTERMDLERICAGYLHLSTQGKGAVSASVTLREMEEERRRKEQVLLMGEDSYQSFYMDSVGNVLATLKNPSEAVARVKVSLVCSCYPVTVDASTCTEDERLNRILALCKHTLKYCRQSHHLDSPRHCEPLACTGDYYIEALMTAFSFGDLRLAEFDLERTAQLLRHNDGRMFHTSYSLIWVRMLYEVYLLGGNFALLGQCRDALDLLLRRFHGYLGENGLVENPPDYMFVDWIYVDGLSMHHPPKALGQTVLNLFYFMALDFGEKIYRTLGDEGQASLCAQRRSALQKAVNSLLFDKERGMYFEGLNTPVPQEQLGDWQKQNVKKRYYLKHSNIMAAYTGVCDGETARSLLEKIMEERIEGEVQPYFQHYLLEAIYRHGLRERYTLPVLRRWETALAQTEKGLAEGFYPPEPGYCFDHSHAWGGTPLYSLPKALSGITVEEAGYEKIKLKPSLLGLAWAKVEIPTPRGILVLEMKQGEAPKIQAPEGIRWEWET